MNPWEELNIIKVYVALTLLFLIIFGRKKSKADLLLTALISAAFLNEVLSIVVLYYGIPVALPTNIYIVFHNIAWLLILREVASGAKFIKWIILLYSVSAIITVAVVTLYTFHFHLFVFGSFIYLIAYMVISIREFHSENLRFFIDEKYILISAPVLFFIGFGLTFGFNTKEMHNATIAGIKLYDWISYSVNFVYYTFINIYIFRQKMNSNAV